MSAWPTLWDRGEASARVAPWTSPFDATESALPDTVHHREVAGDRMRRRLSPAGTVAAKTEIGRACPPDPSPMWHDRVIFRGSCTRGIPFGRLACQGLVQRPIETKEQSQAE